MNIIAQLFQIIGLKRNPQDINYLPIAALLAFLAYTATSTFQIQSSKLMQSPELFAVIQGIAQACIYYTILKINHKQERFIQMATAIFGVSAILQFIGLALLRISALQVLAVVASVWNMALLVIILRSTLECKMSTAILLTILYHFIIGLILMLALPDFFSQMQDVMIKRK